MRVKTLALYTFQNGGKQILAYQPQINKEQSDARIIQSLLQHLQQCFTYWRK